MRVKRVFHKITVKNQQNVFENYSTNKALLRTEVTEDRGLCREGMSALRLNCCTGRAKNKTLGKI